MTIRKSWVGKPPAMCDGCHHPIATSFSDIKTRSGPWGIFCDTCVPSYSIGHKQHYGTGLGQRYQKEPDGKFYKTHG